MTVTVITGTSTGIGLATTLRLAKSGHRVYAGVRNPVAATELQAAIDAGAGAISMLEIDVNDEISVRTAIDRVLAAEGRIDVLINNAGIGRGGAVEETDMSAVRELFETNFFGLVAVTQAVLPGMRRQQSGTIVNVSSIARAVCDADECFLRRLQTCGRSVLGKFGGTNEPFQCPGRYHRTRRDRHRDLRE